MTRSSALIFTLLLLTGGLPIILTIQLASLTHSRFRNELWQLRDALVDDVLSGRLKRSNGARKLLIVIEAYMRLTRRHTLMDLILATAVLRKQELPSLPEEILRDDAEPADRALLTSYLDRFRTMFMTYLTKGSPSSRLTSVALGVLDAVSRRGRRHRREGAPSFRDQAVRVEVIVMSELFPSRRRTRRTNLDVSRG